MGSGNFTSAFPVLFQSFGWPMTAFMSLYLAIALVRRFMR